ncbi:MAG: M90 family metallopeptidase [Bacteroidota bacterium]
MNSTVISITLGLGIGLGALIGYSRLTLKKGTLSRDPNRPFPHQWRSILTRKVQFYNRLNTLDKAKFEKRVHIFLLNVQIVGMNTVVTHEDRILVASGAVIPVFGFQKWHYANLTLVEIYPDKFQIGNTDQFANGLVGSGAMEGKMKLSRRALVDGFTNQDNQQNVAIHEFVHLLDQQDGKIDGVLRTILSDVDVDLWMQVVRNNMKLIDQGNSIIRDYGKTNEAEFFAVASEFFFESPDLLAREQPLLFDAISKFYNPV